MNVRVGLYRKQSTEELMLLNCGVGEDSWESLGLQGDPNSPPKGNQSWVFTGRANVEAEPLILWKGMTEDEIVGSNHWFNGHEFGWTLGAGNGQGGLVCCNAWCCKELDMIERLSWTEENLKIWDKGFEFSSLHVKNWEVITSILTIRKKLNKLKINGSS